MRPTRPRMMQATHSGQLSGVVLMKSPPTKTIITWMPRMKTKMPTKMKFRVMLRKMFRPGRGEEGRTCQRVPRRLQRAEGEDPTPVEDAAVDLVEDLHEHTAQRRLRVDCSTNGRGSHCEQAEHAVAEMIN